MFRPMQTIFSKGFLCVLLALLLGCGEQGADKAAPPQNVKAVVEPFLAELRVGNQEKAAAYVSETAADEFAQSFDTDHKALAKAPPLTANIYDAKGDAAHIVYAAKKDGKWTSVYLRTAKPGSGPLKIEYWRISNQEPALAHKPVSAKKAETGFTLSKEWVYGAGALMLILLLGGWLWLYKYQQKQTANAPQSERRAKAATIGDSE
jgi:hypothetical protein